MYRSAVDYIELCRLCHASGLGYQSGGCFRGVSVNISGDNHSRSFSRKQLGGRAPYAGSATCQKRHFVFG
jgi:hypothetical protein